MNSIDPKVVPKMVKKPKSIKFILANRVSSN